MICRLAVLACLAAAAAAGCAQQPGHATLARVMAPPTCKTAGHWKCPSPSPTPTATSPSPSPTPTGTGTASWAWCTSAAGDFMQFGNLGLYNQANSGAGPQQMCGNSGSDWQVTANDPAGNTGIESYPDSQLNYSTTEPAVAALPASATSSFAEDMHATAGTSAEAAYDIWVTGTGCSRCEVMIWNDTVNRGTVGGAAQVAGPVTFCGQDWTLWQYGGPGGSLDWYLPANEQSGTVCPAQMLQWLQGHAFLPGDAALSQFEYGFEIASTGGADETFAVTSYTVSGLPPRN